MALGLLALRVVGGVLVLFDEDLVVGKWAWGPQFVDVEMGFDLVLVAS